MNSAPNNDPQPVTLTLTLAQVLDLLVLTYWCGNQGVEDVQLPEVEQGTGSQLEVRPKRSDDWKDRKSGNSEMEG